MIIKCDCYNNKPIGTYINNMLSQTAEIFMFKFVTLISQSKTAMLYSFKDIRLKYGFIKLGIIFLSITAGIF